MYLPVEQMPATMATYGQRRLVRRLGCAGINIEN